MLALPARRISEETTQKFRYQCGTYKSKPCQIANYYTPDGTELVAQKLRFADKSFAIVGDMKRAGLYGQHLWRDKGKQVVITEGEIDALTVSQLNGNKYPVVSIPNGANNARAALARQLEWLNGFDAVILMFDNDDPGYKAVAQCADLFPPGKCKIAKLPLKDPNECLVAGKGGAVIDAMWGAKTYRPDGIVTLDDIIDAVEKPAEWGLPWFCDRLTKLTYGRRYGEIYTIGAGTGIGKTDFITQQLAHDITELKVPVGVFFFEQQPEETGKRLAGKVAGRLFHIPDGDWTTDQLKASIAQLRAGGRVFFYDHFGVTDWDIVKSRVRYLAHSEGVRVFYIDHLTAFAAGKDEREVLETVMAEMGGLVKELDIMIILVSHLATPEGASHEEGGRVTIRHFKGARAIGFWSHYMFGLERDTQAEDKEERQTTVFRILKGRLFGAVVGETFCLGYNPDTGMMFEASPTFKTEETTKTDAAKVPF